MWNVFGSKFFWVYHYFFVSNDQVWFVWKDLSTLPIYYTFLLVNFLGLLFVVFLIIGRNGAYFLFCTSFNCKDVSFNISSRKIRMNTAYVIQNIVVIWKSFAFILLNMFHFCLTTGSTELLSFYSVTLFVFQRLHHHGYGLSYLSVEM